MGGLVWTGLKEQCGAYGRHSLVHELWQMVCGFEITTTSRHRTVPSPQDSLVLPLFSYPSLCPRLLAATGLCSGRVLPFPDRPINGIIVFRVRLLSLSVMHRESSMLLHVRYFSPLYLWVVPPCMAVPRFDYPFPSWRTVLQVFRAQTSSFCCYVYFYQFCPPFFLLEDYWDL